MGKIGHDAKAIAFAKWAVWIKIKNAKKVRKTVVRPH